MRQWFERPRWLSKRFCEYTMRTILQTHHDLADRTRGCDDGGRKTKPTTLVIGLKRGKKLGLHAERAGLHRSRRTQPFFTQFVAPETSVVPRGILRPLLFLRT